MPLHPVLRRYAWGSTTMIPSLLGIAPDGSPQAELWFGAHPLGSAQVATSLGTQDLSALIEERPDEVLGGEVFGRFGARLPFLLKVLGVARPLSLQVHPTRQQAKIGFAREEALGVDRQDPARGYRDESHKPELVLAHTRFEALAGFRPMPELFAVLNHLQCDALDDALAPLRHNPTPAGLRVAVEHVLSTPPERKAGLVAAVTGAIEARTHSGSTGVLGADLARVGWVASMYPDDPGVIAALIMRRFVLERGEALFLGAGVLHAYLCGVGIEVQSNSDNVLRGGLTTKPVDVPALLDVVDVAADPNGHTIVRTQGVTTFVPPVEDFALVLHHLGAPGSGLPTEAQVTALGPQILLCLEGAVTVSTGSQPRSLVPGSSVFVPATQPSVTLVGSGTVVRVTANLRPAVEMLESAQAAVDVHVSSRSGVRDAA